MTLEVRRLARVEARAAFDGLARLRIEVFRDFPYLYDGDLDYERRYLDTYLAEDGAAIFGAFDAGTLVGAATASPLANHFEEFAKPFAERGLDVADFYYFGESVLQKRYRGQGVGVRFFEERERAAIEDGFSSCIFSAVIRPRDHPLRPADYTPLDAFWRKRGYRRLDGFVTGFSWRDVGETEETQKPMEFWIKQLRRE
mgnify:FL=1